MRATDPAHRHDRLALRLSVIISRLLAGESLSLKSLSDEFGVSERTLRRDFSQRLLHLDLTGEPDARSYSWCAGICPQHRNCPPYSLKEPSVNAAVDE